MREWGDVIDTEQRGRVAKETRCTDSRAQSHQSQRLGAKPDDKPAYTCCDRRAGLPQMPHLLPAHTQREGTLRLTAIVPLEVVVFFRNGLITRKQD